MRRLRSLTEAWPRLERLYESQVNADGLYPLLSPKQQRHFDQTWTKPTTTNQAAAATATATDASVSSTTADESSVRQREAAVLVILCSVDKQPSILLTRRSPSLTLHASEISFPGGHYDSTKDGTSLQATAIRETREELVPPPGPLEHDLHVYGRTTPIPSLKGTPVTPFLAVLGREQSPVELQSPLSQTFPGDESEVDLVFHVTLQHLIDSEKTHQLPDNRFGLVRAPLFPTPQGDVWGLTAFILKPLLHRLWAPAFTYQEDSDNP